MNARRMLLRAWLASAAAVAAPWQAASWAAAPSLLAHPESLANELARALGVKRALVLMVSLDGCPYCKLVRESYLLPLRASGQPVFQVELSDAVPVLDLRGRPSTHARVVRELGIRVAPTVVFVGRGGAEVAERLVGIASQDFYGAYLQERVEAANRTVAS